jgi:hypothetical protein
MLLGGARSVFTSLAYREISREVFDEGYGHSEHCACYTVFVSLCAC